VAARRAGRQLARNAIKHNKPETGINSRANGTNTDQHVSHHACKRPSAKKANHYTQEYSPHS
jgi:hypothetical protein